MSAAWIVGQSAIVVRHTNDGPEISDVKIVKVGRKWVTACRDYGRWAQEERFDFQGHSETRTGHGARLWRTRGDFEANKALNRAWSHFSQAVRNTYTMPSHLTLTDIEQMTAMLKGDAR